MTPKSQVYAKLIGKPVLVRDDKAGVLFGILEDVDGPLHLFAPGARKIHYWTQAAAVEGVGVRGIGPGSRVTPPVSCGSVVANVVQLLGLTDAEYAKLNAEPEWDPRQTAGA